jgi:hypothetical protein
MSQEQQVSEQPIQLTNNNTTTTPSGQAMFSPFKGPKIAWKKQFKRQIVTSSTNTSNTMTTSSVNNNKFTFTIRPVPPQQAQQDLVPVVLSTRAQGNNKENDKDPKTPPKKSVKRKVMSPLASFATTSDSDAPSSSSSSDILLVSRKICFSGCLNNEFNVQIVKQPTTMTSPRERKLAKRVILNRVDNIQQNNSSTNKVALKFVF